MEDRARLDIVREAMWIAAEQSQNHRKSASEMYALAVALFGEELVNAVTTDGTVELAKHRLETIDFARPVKLEDL